MRPERLEIAGFTAFRAATEIDFTGVDLFAITGPTGSGKSSVIDAITFALYGVVARFDDKRKVGGVISVGSAEARVRFDFSLEGRRYAAARVVRRQTRGGGATTAEARLERDGEAIASGAEEVGRAVESLLGLGVDHFLRCVVLPQGAFAAFLHSKPSSQQDLIKALLDLDLLDLVRAGAHTRRTVADDQARRCASRLESLADATQEAEDLSREALRRLTALESQVSAHQDELAKAATAATRAGEALDQRRSVIDRLSRVRVPDGIDRASQELAQSGRAAVKLRGDLEAASERVTAARSALAGLPSPDWLARMAAARAELEETARRKEAIDLAAMDTEVALRRAERESAEEAAAAADSNRDQVRRRHAAHDLAAGLVAGEPCPVCDRPLDRPPAPAVPEEFVAAALAFEEAGARLVAARAAEADAGARSAAATAERAGLDERAERLRSETESGPDPAGLAELEGAVAAAGAGVTAAEKAAEKARASLVAAEADREQAGAQVERLRADLHRQRDSLAGLEPPLPGRQDLAADWKDLADWATQEKAEMEKLVAEAAASVESATGRLAAIQGEVAALLAAEGLGPTDQPAVAVGRALEAAQGRLDRIIERRAESEAVMKEAAEATEAALVAGALAGHLQSNRFEAWVLAEALANLVAGTNDLLADLSGGAYSLHAADRTFAVIDHVNADERRSVRTLSGGETFIVSLALALSLGEQLAALSVQGGPPLESIFLDEGFGTLDDETLATVATVVDDLASRGRVVGLITHVKELADQVPVRFEVRKGPSGATVERVAT